MWWGLRFCELSETKPTISAISEPPYSSFINGLKRCARSSIWNQSSCS